MRGSGPRVSADHGSTAAGRDLIGILPEQLPAIVKAANDPLERLIAKQRDTIAGLERQPPQAGPIYENLPDLPDGYLPREADLQALKALLISSDRNTGRISQSRAAGLRGMGGVGKTVLAAALVHDSDVRLAFPYGIVWLRFRRTANALVQSEVLALVQLEVLARAVTGQPASYRSVPEAHADLGRLLRDLRLLIVLDNVWEPGLVDGFRGIAPGCQLLITTRQQMVVDRAEARAHELGLLNLCETRDLFMKALGTADLPPEADAVIGECGGLPLAIAAAAGMVRRSGWAHTWNAFALARLDALRTPWLPESEHQNLEIVLAASVQTLSERERACFHQCAIWPEEVAVSISALQLFWSAHVPHEFDQREVAETLIAASVLQRGSGETVRLHDLYHDYLRHVAGDSLAAMQGALADRCVRFTENGCELLDRSAWTLEHLPWHLLQAGRPEKAKALQLDYDWLASKLAVRSVQLLIADTHLVEDPELEQLGGVLRLSTHILARDQGQLSAQLLGRLHNPCGSGAAKLLAAAFRELPQNVLIPRGGKHLSESGSLIAVFEGHHGEVRGALLLPDGRRALSWSTVGPLWLWDLESGEGRLLQGHGGSVDGALLLPDGRRALSWSVGRLWLWDLESGEGRPQQRHGSWVLGVRLLPDGRRALSWSADRTLRLWDLTEWHEAKRFVGDDFITTVLPSAPRQLLLAGDARGRIMVFDLPP